jgi:hypothetical protein
MNDRSDKWTALGGVFAMGLIISPDALVFTGQMAGRLGSLLPLGLLVAALFHGATVAAGGFPTTQAQGAPSVLLVLARIVLTLFALTGALVSAGYAVNEIFIHWFPNFGAAGILLAATLAVCAVGGTAGIVWQTAMTAVWGLLLAALAIAGLITGGKPPSPEWAWTLNAGLMAPFALLAALAGHDLAGRDRADSGTPVGGAALIWGVVLIGAILHALWGLAAAASVPPERLARSTIPHLIAARAVLGDTGRIMMGAVIIAGAAGFGHAIIDGTARVLQQAAAHFSGRSTIAAADSWRVAMVGVLGASVALAMMGGLAGGELLEAGIFAGLALLMGHYAWVHWKRVAQLRDRQGARLPGARRLVIFIHLVSMAAFVFSAVGAVWHGVLFLNG